MKDRWRQRFLFFFKDVGPCKLQGSVRLSCVSLLIVKNFWTMETSMLICVVLVVLAISLLFSSRNRSREKRTLSTKFCLPLILICNSQSLCRQALHCAEWPESIRISKASMERDDRLAVFIEGTLELFPGWDKIARDNSMKGSIVSHHVRRSLRALASSKIPHALPQAFSHEADGPNLKYPEIRILLGSYDLVQAALSMIDAQDSEVVSGCRIALWLNECGLTLGCSDREIAYEPGGNRD